MFILKKVKYTIPVFLCILSCAHMNSYNTYYNATEAYKGATSGESPNVGLLDECLKKCSKILTYYPNTRWVDDAIMLSGKCFYEKGDTSQAELKFKEIINFYPESKFVPEAAFMLGKINILKGSETEADRWFEMAVKDERLKEEIKFWLISSYFLSGRYEKTLKKGNLYLDSFKEGELKEDLLLLLGEASDSIERYEDALNYYKKALAIDEKDFIISIRIANILIKMKNIEEAKALCNSIESKNPEEERILKKTMAICFEMEGDLKNAISNLLELNDQESLFHIAKIYEQQLNLGKTLENYDNAAKLGLNTEIGKISKKKAEALKEMLAIRKSLGIIDTTQIDTLSIDTTNITVDSTVIDTGDIVMDTSFTAAVIDSTALIMRLAELWLLEFDNPDEALIEYRMLIEDFPDNEHIPKALYAIAWIEQNIKGNNEEALSIYRQIEENYPDTDYEYAAKRQIEIIEQKKEGREKSDDGM